MIHKQLWGFILTQSGLSPKAVTLDWQLGYCLEEKTAEVLVHLCRLPIYVLSTGFYGRSVYS